MVEHNYLSNFTIWISNELFYVQVDEERKGSNENKDTSQTSPF